MSLPRHQVRELQRQRELFQTTYTYGPARPEYPFLTQGNITSYTGSKRRSPLVPAFITFVLIAGSIGIASKLLKNEPQTSAQPQTRSEQKVLGDTQTVAAIKTPAVETTTLAEMADSITKTIAANQAINTSVSITDLTSGETYNYGLDVKFEAASTGKMVTAVALMQQVEAGKLKLSDTTSGVSYDTLLTKMIEVSDNDAWAALNTKLGHTLLQNTANAIGMTTYVNATNLMKSQDLNTLLTKLYQGKLLNKSNQDILLGHMKKANRTDYIESALPGGLNIYHKAGWLEDRSHDGAIIDNGSHPYILVIYTKGSDESQRKLMLHKVTIATVAHFIGKDTAAQIVSD